MKTGIYHDIPNEIYHRGDGWRDLLGSTGLKTLQISPAHFKAMGDKESTKAMIFGSAFHSSLLEPEKKEVAVMPDINRRTKAGKEQYEQFLKTAEGKYIIDSADYERIDQMLVSVYASSTASSLLANGKAEVSAIWKDPTYGFLCKCRPDFLRNDGIIVDVKTTSKPATPDQFSKECANFGYHISAAWYQAGVLAATGKAHNFVFLVVETFPPFGVNVFEPDQTFLDAGRREIKPIIELYDRCKESGEWPGYDDTVNVLTLPSWAA